MKNDKITPERLEWCKANAESVKKSILAGEVYAQIKSVTRSGMSRRICFYRIVTPPKKENRKPYLERITAEIGWLTGWLPMGQYNQGGKWVVDEGLRVSGCGMDMVFHTLYSALPYEQAKDWDQKYSII